MSVIQRVSFRIHTTPVAKGRPRATSINGKARVYTPKKTAHFEAIVAETAEAHIGKLMEGPIEVSLSFYLPRPKRLQRKKDSSLAIVHTSKPDVDNLAKSVLDGLQAFMGDDAQVYRLTASKYYAGKGVGPYVDVALCEFLPYQPGGDDDD